jgi:hypothetical protein
MPHRNVMQAPRGKGEAEALVRAYYLSGRARSPYLKFCVYARERGLASATANRRKADLVLMTGSWPSQVLQQQIDDANAMIDALRATNAMPPEMGNLTVKNVFDSMAEEDWGEDFKPGQIVCDGDGCVVVPINIPGGRSQSSPVLDHNLWPGFVDHSML